MPKSKVVQLTALLLCAALLFASSTLAPQINSGRADMNMGGMTGEDPIKNAPPEYAFAIQALGAFRGLLTNIAFIRATQLKEEGRYFDAMQLAGWICKLQPRFPSVWTFQSWNMAWNISVTTFTPEERWNWVYNGVELGRDEGLKYNPRAVNLYKQIAWIYVNKMSETIDEYHLTFKREWAWRMHLVLGEPPNPLEDEESEIDIPGLLIGENDRFDRALRKLGDTPPVEPPKPEVAEDDTGQTPFEIAREVAYLRVQEIDDAPRTLDALYEQQPETREMVARLREMDVDIRDRRLGEDEYWAVETGLAHSFFGRYRKLSDPVSIMMQISTRKLVDADQANIDAFDEIVGVRAGLPAGEALLRFMQRKVLNEVYKLDTAHMVEVMKYFGPMDWRVVDAHSLYWVTQSIIKGGETMQKFGNDKINTLRLLFFSLRNLRLRNKLIFEPYPKAISFSYFNPTLDMNFIEPMQQAFIEYGPALFGGRDIGAGAGDTFRAGHINFLTESIRLLYLANRKREAAKYYRYLRETYSVSQTGKFNAAFSIPLDEFVERSFTEGLDGGRETQGAVNAWLANGYAALANSNFVQYQNLRAMALKLHRNYHGQLSDMAASKRLAPFNEMQVDVLMFTMRQPSVAVEVALLKVRLWRNLPQNLKRAVYDQLKELFSEECRLAEFDLAKAFPEPAGMEAFREVLERRGPEDQQKAFETIVQPGG
ncbi:MAG: hypothetical protein IID33_01290 [Planctomycetes bacterium]|nr:hypothetical protein [Planctomycetota bacterium]